MPGRRTSPPAQPLGRADQGDPEQHGEGAARGGTEQPLVHRVADQEDAGEHQGAGAEPDTPARGEQRLDVAGPAGGGRRDRDVGRLRGYRCRLGYRPRHGLRRSDVGNRCRPCLNRRRGRLRGGQRCDGAAQSGDLGTCRQCFEKADDSEEPAADQDQHQQNRELFHPQGPRCEQRQCTMSVADGCATCVIRARLANPLASGSGCRSDSNRPVR